MTNQIISADWILPVTSSPINDGSICIVDQKIADFGPSKVIQRKYNLPVTGFENSVVVPGWVNAHCHLELSLLKDEISREGSFVDWIEHVIEARTHLNDPERTIEQARRQLEHIRQTGTVLVADITNGELLSTELQVDGIERIINFEILGFQSDKAEQIYIEAFNNRQKSNPAANIVPHAPYSVSSKLIKKMFDRNSVFSIHTAESCSEVEFIKSGSGPFKDLLINRKVWDESWQGSRLSPVKYLNELEVLNDNTLLVHAVQIDADDISILKRQNVNVCLCPRSNHQLKVGQAPVDLLVANRVNTCIGTDSLASNEDLDMNNEIKFLFEHSNLKNPAEIIRIATINGARALQRDDRLGSIEIGKQAKFNIFSSGKKNIVDPEYFVVAKEWSQLHCL